MRFIRFCVQFVAAIVIFLLFFVFIVISVALLSAGFLAFPAALAVLTGLFTNVASDLSPPAMLFGGAFCISTGLLIALLIVILFPKQPSLIRRILKEKNADT